MISEQPKVDLDSILSRYNASSIVENGEPIPAPGTADNPWIGVERITRGQKTFYAFSGAERRGLRRQHERDVVNEQQRGQRAYNRQQRQVEFDADTVRQQLRILKGELKVSPAMEANLTAHIVRQQRLAERAPLEQERKDRKIARAEERLFRRQAGRYAAGKPRHADLVALGHRVS